MTTLVKSVVLYQGSGAGRNMLVGHAKADGTLLCWIAGHSSVSSSFPHFYSPGVVLAPGEKLLGFYGTAPANVGFFSVSGMVFQP